MNAPPLKPRNRFALPLVGLAALFLAPPSCKPPEGSAAAAPPEVLVKKAAARDVPVYREWIGTLQGSENADIRARVAGFIIKRDYQEGALIKKGHLLFQLDARPFETALSEAKFQLAQGCAIQCASQSEYERSKALFEQKVISEKEFINKTQLNESNRAKVEALTAAVELARLNVEYCRISSPIDGIVAIAQANVGDLVGTAGNPVLTTVSTLDPIKIVFPISETEYFAASQRVQESMGKPFNQRPESIELILAGGKLYPRKARLLSVDLQVKASTGTILVTALLPNPGNVLRPGVFARARIVANVLKDAVVVPQQAVNEIQGTYQLGIVGADGKAEIRMVQVGVRADQDWVITSGLKKGEKVVVEGFQKIKQGMPVTTKPWKSGMGKAATPATEENPDAQPEAP